MKKEFLESMKLFCTIKHAFIEVKQEFVEIYNRSSLVYSKKGNRICSKGEYCAALHIKCIYANDPQGISPLRDIS